MRNEENQYITAKLLAASLCCLFSSVKIFVNFQKSRLKRYLRGEGYGRTLFMWKMMFGADLITHYFATLLSNLSIYLTGQCR